MNNSPTNHLNQVHLARRLQWIDLLVATQALEGIAGLASGTAVIDQQGGTPGLPDQGTDVAAKGGLLVGYLEGLAGFHFEFRAFEAAADPDQSEGQVTVIGHAHAALCPAVLGLHELAGGQAVQHFIGDQDHRGVGIDPVQRGDPARVEVAVGQHPALCLAQRRAGLDQDQVDGAQKLRVQTGGAQGVGHQCPVAGPDLDQPHPFRCAQPPP